MPSFTHELLVELFRARCALAPELLRRAQIELGAGDPELGSIDLSQVAPTEYRSDAVVILRDPDRNKADPIAAIVVEVQLREDADKRFTWPVYVAALRHRLRCPVYLLVLAPDVSVAEWARVPIEMGQAGFVVTPTVLSFEDIPRTTDPSIVQRVPELAVLSVFAHPVLEVARTAIAAIKDLAEDERKVYDGAILATLSEIDRKALENHMKSNYDPVRTRRLIELFKQERAMELEQAEMKRAMEFEQAKMKLAMELEQAKMKLAMELEQAEMKRAMELEQSKMEIEQAKMEAQQAQETLRRTAALLATMKLGEELAPADMDAIQLLGGDALQTLTDALIDAANAAAVRTAIERARFGRS